MAKGDGATVDVNLIHIPLQFFADGQRLCGKGFVGFDQVQIGDLPVGLGQTIAGSRYRSNTHNGRIPALA